MNELELRAVVVATAQSWIGKNEADGSHRRIIDLYNSHLPLPRGYRVRYTDDWCATFVSAVGYACGFSDIIPPECGCEEQVKLLRAKGMWKEDDDYVPRPGDLIYYDWQGGGPGDNYGWSDHVGIVERVDGRVITVIEGNRRKSVCRRTVQVGWPYIRGFGVPDYQSKSTSANPKPDWKSEAMLGAKKRGLMDGTRPDDPVTRAELAVVANRLYDKIKEGK